MTGKGLVKVVAFKVCREVALDVLCHLGRFHASPTAKHDTLFQVLVENLSLDVLAISQISLATLIVISSFPTILLFRG